MKRTTCLALAACLLLGCGKPTEKNDSNSATNGAPNSSSSNASTMLSAVPPDFERLITAMCSYALGCEDPEFASISQCEDYYRVELEPDSCFRYDHPMFETCASGLEAGCSGTSDTPDACDEYVDYSECCAQDGQVAVDGECVDPCDTADECAFGFACITQGCVCEEVQAVVNDVLMCLKNCDDVGACDAGFSCFSGLCVPDSP